MKATYIKFRDKLVNNVREVWRHWSLRLGIAGTALAGWFFASPESAVAAWAMLPDDLKASLPPSFVGRMGVALFTLSLLAKFVKQRKLSSNQDAAAKRTALD